MLGLLSLCSDKKKLWTDDFFIYSTLLSLETLINLKISTGFLRDGWTWFIVKSFASLAVNSNFIKRKENSLNWLHFFAADALISFKRIRSFDVGFFLFPVRLAECYMLTLMMTMLTRKSSDIWIPWMFADFKYWPTKLTTWKAIRVFQRHSCFTFIKTFAALFDVVQSAFIIFENFSSETLQICISGDLTMKNWVPLHVDSVTAAKHSCSQFILL